MPSVGVGDVNDISWQDKDPGIGYLKTRCPDGKMCYGETACKYESNGKYACYCWHTSTPPRKGWECDRIVVSDDPTPISPFRNPSGLQQQQHHEPIRVYVGSYPSQLNSTFLNSAGQVRPTTTTPASKTSGIENQYMILLVSAALVLTILITLATCFLKRRKMLDSFHQRRLQEKADESNQSMNNMGNLSQVVPHDRFINNPSYETSTPLLLSTVSVFKQSEIMNMIQIGEGCFGKVFKGEMNDTPVAVKVIKKEHSEEALREIEVMTTFDHPNILKLLGIAQNSDSGIPWLIFELMEFGDLITAVRKARNHDKGNLLRNNKETLIIPIIANVENSLLSTNHLELTKNSLLEIARQVAEGMKYLSSQHFVHRDVAARNCLLGSNGDKLHVKISDFGLSRDVYTCDYYKVGGSRLLPVRWMAPECVLYGRFTLESDVWAYGVLLWEIYTWGVQPYFGHSNEEVVQLVLDGVLLCPPSDCPPIICDVMIGTWKTNPKHRLTFVEICELFQRALNKVQENSIIPLEQQQPQVDRCAFVSNSSNYELPKVISPVEYMQVV